MTAPASARAPASLSRRLILAALVWLLLLLAVGGGVLAYAFRASLEREFSYRLDAILKTMIASTEVGPDGTVRMVRPMGDARFDRIFSGWYWQITGPDGRQLRSRSLWDSAIATTAGGSDMETRRVDGPNGEPLLVVERDLRYPGNANPVHLLVAADLREVSSGVRRFDLLLVTALGLLGIGMAVAIVIQVRYGLRPLRTMAADLEDVRSGDATRLAGKYPPEVAPLVEAMNGVLDKDAELIERARAHVGNLAHALKTSLAVLSTELQGSAKKEVMAEQVQIMRRLIEHHLGRASAMAGSGRNLGVKSAIRPIAESAAAALRKIYVDRGLVIDVDVAPELSFRGPREDLEEIIGNLMENACKWAKSRVRISGRQDQAGLHLAVEDDGPGMPPDQAAEAVVRGRRLDEMAPGWGLGLAIVSDLVDVNGGQIAFARSDFGGLAVTIRLPAR